MPPVNTLWLTLISLNYPCLEHIFMVPKVFETLKFYCISIFSEDCHTVIKFQTPWLFKSFQVILQEQSQNSLTFPSPAKPQYFPWLQWPHCSIMPWLCCHVVTLYQFNPNALRKAKIVYNFGLSECNRVTGLKLASASSTAISLHNLQSNLLMWSPLFFWLSCTQIKLKWTCIKGSPKQPIFVLPLGDPWIQVWLNAWFPLVLGKHGSQVVRVLGF